MKKDILLGIALPKIRKPADEEVEEIVITVGSRDILRESARVVVDVIIVGAEVDVLGRVNVTSAAVLVISLGNVLRSVALLVQGIKSVITVADLAIFHAIAQILVQISRSGVITVSR